MKLCVQTDLSTGISRWALAVGKSFLKGIPLVALGYVQLASSVLVVLTKSVRFGLEGRRVYSRCSIFQPVAHALPVAERVLDRFLSPRRIVS